MSEEFKQGDKVKFLPPANRKKIRRHGVKPASSGVLVFRNESKALLRYNQIFQISESTKELITNNTIKPFPLICADFIRTSKLKSRFKLVESKIEENKHE